MTVTKWENQKQENLINNLKQSISNLQAELKVEKEKYAKFEKECIQYKAKNLDAIKTNKEEIDRLKQQIKLSKAKESKKLPSVHSKLSRNSNKQDLTHFSIFTNSLKTQKNVSQKNISYSNQNKIEETSNICSNCKIQEWIKEQLDYDHNKLIENRDMIKQVLCIGWNAFKTSKEFVSHVDSCRSKANITKLDSKLASSKSQMIKTRPIREKFCMKSKIGSINRNNDPSPIETRASGISPSSRIISKLYGSPQNSFSTKAKNMFSNWKSVSSMKPLENNVCAESTNTPDWFKKLKLHAVNSRVNANKALNTVRSPPNSKLKKTILIQLEDEDIVNREESFISEYLTKITDNAKQGDKDEQSKDEEQRFSFESFQKSGSSILGLYYSNQNKSISSKIQPRGDEEDEIVFE